MISIIIPTLNEASQIRGTLEAVFAMHGTFEVIVVDGGSIDHTLCLVQEFPKVRLFIADQAGRAYQMNIGADEAKGRYLLFLHADTHPCKTCVQCLEQQVQDPQVVGGSFRMEFDQPQWPYRCLSFTTRFNSRFWTFGDQGIFVKKNIFFQLGGYAPIPILEDLEIQIRLRELGKFIKVHQALRTSARRYAQNGLWKELLVDTSVVVAYFLGVSPYRLKRWYDRKKRIFKRMST